MSFLPAVALDQPGKKVFLSGNEAFARGALEAGVAYATSYPGSPTAEVLEILSALAKTFNFYAEWSVNEKVAMEGAAAASFAGLRSLVVMKCDGLNVAFDFLTSLALAGTKGGMVILVGDDPGAHSSAKEEDSRYLGKLAHIPVLEPADPQEAKEAMVAAFELSEFLRQPVMLRSVTRVCHAGGDVALSKLQQINRLPFLDREEHFITWIEFHATAETKIAQAAAWGENTPLNTYVGPERTKWLLITEGPCFHYAREAVVLLGWEEKVGILKLGMVWPLPEEFLKKHLMHAEKVIFGEEVEPFTEENVKALVAQYGKQMGFINFYGKKSGHVAGPAGPGLGEMNPDIIMQALKRIEEEEQGLPVPQEREESLVAPGELPNRELAFCPGCPHRASFWALKGALELDGRGGFVLGDIGCYTLGKGRTGYNLLQTMHAMGSGAGLACGFGQLSRFGFNQPVVAVGGDSTFYHAIIPALVNAKYNQADFLLVILDNETTAMTGHQPHPGTGLRATGEGAEKIALEEIVAGLKIPLFISDPYAVDETRAIIFRLLQEKGPRVLILRRICALIAAKTKKPRVYVDPARCLGDACGCARFCSRVFACPANIWDEEKGKAVIDEVICNGCGVCASLCPQRAIVVEEAVLVS